MPTLKQYLFDPALTGSAFITDIGQDKHPWVRLDRTLFHPQGGGQKADCGNISGTPVLHVVKDGDEVNHYVDDTTVFQVGQPVEMCVDTQHRLSNSRLHSGGHLIASVGHRLFPQIKAVSGHHWPDEARVEFDGDALPDVVQFRASLEEALAQAIREDQPICVVGDPLVSRTIQINTDEPIPCGGTHAERTGQLNGISLTSVKIKGGKLRVSYHL